MGSKYEFKPDKNPAVGTYDAASAKDKLMERSGGFAYKRPVSPARRPKETYPEPG